MVSALVLGSPGSGLTTFLGLLYTAQLRRGTELEDGFRFSAERETVRQLEPIYGELVAGRFPEEDADWESSPLSFLLGRRKRNGGRPGAGRFDSVQLQIGGMTTESVSELADHDAVLESTTRRLLRSPIVIALLDATRLRRGGDNTPDPWLVRYDDRLARSLELIAKFVGANQTRGRAELHPLFVITKFDRCPTVARAELGLPPGDLQAWPSEIRGGVAQRALGNYLPNTALVFDRAKQLRALDIDPPALFFSGLRMEDRNGESRIVRRSRFPVGSWEPEYPFQEYSSLIATLTGLAHRFRDEGEAS